MGIGGKGRASSFASDGEGKARHDGQGGQHASSSSSNKDSQQHPSLRRATHQQLLVAAAAAPHFVAVAVELVSSLHVRPVVGACRHFAAPKDDGAGAALRRQHCSVLPRLAHAVPPAIHTAITAAASEGADIARDSRIERPNGS